MEDIDTQTLLEKILTPEVKESKPEDTTLSQVKEKEYKDKPKIKMHKAHNVFYDVKSKKFKLVTIEYNPKNLDYSRVVSVELFSDNGMVATKKLMDIFTMKLARGEEIEND